MAQTSRVIGAERLAATLRRAARDVADMPEAGARAAIVVRQDASRRAPKRTGRLARSITPTVRGNVAQIRATAPYGVHVEYGTRRMRARPFMRPALAAKTEAVTAIYSDEVDRTLSQVKGA